MNYCKNRVANDATDSASLKESMWKYFENTLLCLRVPTFHPLGLLIRTLIRQIWSYTICGVLLTEPNWSRRRTTCPNAILSTTYITRIGSRSNPGFDIESRWPLPETWHGFRITTDSLTSVMNVRRTESYWPIHSVAKALLFMAYRNKKIFQHLRKWLYINP